MRFGAIAATLALGVLTTALAGSAVGQSGHGHQPTPGQPPGHGHQHGGPGHQPHAGGDAAVHRRVEAYLKEFDAVVADGRGFGLAFAADQNGYPGPLHVLELKDQLTLTPAQEARMTTLFDAMLIEARAKAAHLADAEVRLVHLLTHLETRDVLTEAQRRAYHQLRWGTTKNH